MKVNLHVLNRTAIIVALCGLGFAVVPVQAQTVTNTPEAIELKARPPLGEAFVIVTETEDGKRLDIDCNRVQILAVLRLIGRKTNLNVIIDKDASKTREQFDGELFKAEPEDAIRFFAHQAYLTYRKIDDETYVISRAAKR